MTGRLLLLSANEMCALFPDLMRTLGSHLRLAMGRREINGAQRSLRLNGIKHAQSRDASENLTKILAVAVLPFVSPQIDAEVCWL
jgi:hypothetical protein